MQTCDETTVAFELFARNPQGKASRDVTSKEVRDAEIGDVWSVWVSSEFSMVKASAELVDWIDDSTAVIRFSTTRTGGPRGLRGEKCELSMVELD